MRLAAALAQKNADSGAYCWIAAIIEETSTLVWEEGNAFWAATYDVADNSVTIKLTDVKRVMPRTVWDAFDGAVFESANVKEANKAKLAKDGPIDEELRESASIFMPIARAFRESIGTNTKALIKLIAPGWGSNGYYSKETLKLAAKERVFHAGLQMLWNHPTDQEEMDRPEGDLRDLAAVLTEDAKWMDNGPTGPGLYAMANVFDKFRETLSNIWEHIGVSIRYFGSHASGAAEGRAGELVTQIRRALSVDFVTLAGAGGEVVQMFESARGAQPLTGAETMNEEQLRKMLESLLPGMLSEATKPLTEGMRALQNENKALQVREGLRTAAGLVRAEYTKPGVVVHAAMLEAAVSDLCLAAPMTEAGALDETKFKPMLEARLKRDAELFSTLTGSGNVTGAGSSAPAELSDEDYAKRMESVGRSMGLSEKEAKAWAA